MTGPVSSCRRRTPAIGLASALIVWLAIPALPGAQALAAPAAAMQAQPPTLEDFKATLSGFGKFIYSERYGNVWQPSSLPDGWHPYPACHWVYDRTYGWTYDDKTPWGRIVHHYGRWAHDDSGWVWVPGTQWAPAWVIWRTGGDWTGWAPTPPAADQQEVSLAVFNTDKQWTFVETAQLANECAREPTAAPASVFASTRVVTAIKVVRGISVYALTPPDTAIDYDTGPIAPWPSDFLGEWITWLSGMNSSSSLALSEGTPVCPPAAPLPAAVPYPSAPPPAPTKKQGKKPVKAKNYRPAPPTVIEKRVYEAPEPAYEAPPVYVEPPYRRYRPPYWEPGRPRPPYIQPRPPYPGPGYVEHGGGYNRPGPRPPSMGPRPNRQRPMAGPQDGYGGQREGPSRFRRRPPESDE